jgi:hypothetical protein
VLIADGRYYERVSYFGKAITVSSEYILDQDTSHILNTIIDGDTTVLGVSDTGCVVHFRNGEDSSSVLIGITITNGIGWDFEKGFTMSGSGGGIYCEDASPLLQNCRIEGNSSALGGGAYFRRSRSVIVECEFENNTADAGGGVLVSDSGVVISRSSFRNNTAGDASGGAMTSSSDGPGNETLVSDCIFEGNHAWDGGAISGGASSAMVIERCVFLENSADNNGGAIRHYVGSLRIVNSVFLNNSAERGGALHIGYTSATVATSIFAGNLAASFGGALFGCPDTLINCSFVANRAPNGSGLYNVDESDLIKNCIFAGNLGGEPIWCPSEESNLDISCTNICANEAGDWLGCLAALAEINGNFSADPQFCDPPNTDYHLRPYSPCAPANNDCGVLIGALPVGCSFECGDFDGDGSQNISDAVYLLQYIFGQGPPPLDVSGGDINCNGKINISDIVYLIYYIFYGGPEPCAECE